MIRNKFTLTLISSVDNFANAPSLYYKSPGIQGDYVWIFNENSINATYYNRPIDQQIISFKDIIVNKINELGLANEIWVTYTNNSLTLDYKLDNSWLGVASLTFFGDENYRYFTFGNGNGVFGKGYLTDRFNADTISYEYNDGIIPPIPEPPIPMEVKGLDSDLYYINNPIFVEVQPSTNGISNYLDLSVTDLQTQKVHTSRIYYFNNNVLTFDISVVIKSLMRDAQMNFDFTTLVPFDNIYNYGRFKITLNRVVSEQNTNTASESNYIEITKTFIRGGVREQGSNFTATRNKGLRGYVNFPYWDGYPCSEYYINTNGQTVKLNNLDLINDKENIPLNGCNPYLVVFLNQLGGFEHWMFYGSKTDVTSTNAGYSNVFNKIVDFGNTETRTQTVNARIPLYYAGMIPDLLISSVIYIYTKSKGWERVISKGNKVTVLDTKRAYEVDFKFEKVNNFNPSNLL